MATNQGFGERLGARLREMGYWPEGRELPDYGRFGLDFHHTPASVYRWLKGEVPRVATFLKLAADVDRQAHYLLTGTTVPNPTAGMTIPDYIGVLQKDLNARTKKTPKAKRRSRSGYYVKFMLAWLAWSPRPWRNPCLQPQVALAA